MIASSSVAGWFMLFDAIIRPADGAVSPAAAWKVNADQTIDFEHMHPIECNTGAIIVFSTTGPYTLTASATAFIVGKVR